MIYENHSVKELKIAYIGGGSRGWAWTLMNDLAKATDMSVIAVAFCFLELFINFCHINAAVNIEQ